MLNHIQLPRNSYPEQDIRLPGLSQISYLTSSPKTIREQISTNGSYQCF